MGSYFSPLVLPTIRWCPSTSLRINAPEIQPDLPMAGLYSELKASTFGPQRTRAELKAVRGTNRHEYSYIRCGVGGWDSGVGGWDSGWR